MGSRAGSSGRQRGTQGGKGSRQGATNGGDAGDWIDVSPRRRKALRQEGSGQDRYDRGDRNRQRDTYFNYQSRFTNDLWEDRYAGHYDAGSEFSNDRPILWGDSDSVDDGADSDESREEGEWSPPARRQGTARHTTKRAAAVVQHQKPHTGSWDGKGTDKAPSFKRFVTFYITNFPPQASTVFLRKGFEVCGILEEVFVARNINVYGEVYGFVRYAKVRDVNKLLKALNNVSFGQFHVYAKLARFDKRVPKEGEAGRVRVREGEGGKVEGKVTGAGRRVTAVRKVLEGEKSVRMGSEKEDEGLRKMTGFEGELRVGSVVLKMGRKERRKVGEGENVVEVGTGKSDRNISTDKQTVSKTFVRRYTLCDEDVEWASNGLVGTVLNGESIPIIQDIVEDAGFKDINIIPLGADKVFVHSLSDVSVVDIVGKAKPFFDLIFSSISKWEKRAMPYHRGAWLRVYGIPLHAWNENFFKLCVLDRGRYLRTDSCSLSRERFDYARVLIATSSLDVVNVTKNILIDGESVAIKIVEEWGFNMGEDVCLYEDDDKSVKSCPEEDVLCDELETNNRVENLANKLDIEIARVAEEDNLFEERTKEGNMETTEMQAPVGDPGSPIYLKQAEMCYSNAKELSARGGTNTVTQSKQLSHGDESDSCEKPMSHASGVQRVQVKEGVRKRRIQSTTNCNKEAQSSGSGPWSVEWLYNAQRGDVGLISSNQKRLKKTLKAKSSIGRGNRLVESKKKAGGALRHPVLTLKKVARLPTKDRQEVMKVLKHSNIMKGLKKKVRNRQRQRERVTQSLEGNQSLINESSSLASVNKDWKNWVKLQGQEEEVEEDIRDIGKAIGLTFKGDLNNKFSVLSRPKTLDQGPILSEVDGHEREGVLRGRGGGNRLTREGGGNEVGFVECEGVRWGGKKARGVKAGDGEKTDYSLYSRNQIDGV